MTKEDYREKVEEHRQEIDLHNESGSKMSRVSRNRKKNAKKQSSPMMTILTVVLIFIPLLILGYVWLVYEPNTSASEGANLEEKDDLVVEIQKQEPKTAGTANEEDNDEEANASDTADAAAQQAEKERLAAEEAKKAEEKLANEKAALEAAEAKKAEEQQKIAAAKAKELEEAKKNAAALSQQKTHTVQSTDNLYRIALKYYGNGSAENIQKIKAANNLSSDSISTGQVLVIVP